MHRAGGHASRGGQSEPADGPRAAQGAACAGVRSGRQRDPLATGATGSQEWPCRSQHHGRLQGSGVDRQRRRRCARVSFAGQQVPRAKRPCRKILGRTIHGEFRARAESSSTQQEAAIADGYLNSASPCSTRTPAFSVLGAGLRPDDTNLGTRHNPRRRLAPTCIAPSSVDRSPSATARTIASRFTEDGRFVEMFIKKKTLGDGSVWDISRPIRSRMPPHISGRQLRARRLHHARVAEIPLELATGPPAGQFSRSTASPPPKGNLFTTRDVPGPPAPEIVFKGVEMVPRDRVVWPRK